jgi:hypothetical protein
MALRYDFVQIASAERNAMEDILRENRFAAMTMNGGQVRAFGLFITNFLSRRTTILLSAHFLLGKFRDLQKTKHHYFRRHVRWCFRSNEGIKLSGS